MGGGGGGDGTEAESGRRLLPWRCFYWGGSQEKGSSLWDIEWMFQPLPPQMQGPRPHPTRPSPRWPASVSLTPGRLWDKGLGGLCSLPWFCSSGSSSHVWPLELQEPGRTNYHQHAVGDEDLRWRGTGKQNENFWSVISFLPDFSRGVKEPK